MSELQGGKFGHGFASAGITKALTPAFSGVKALKFGDVSIAQAAIAAVIGGTISDATGGKFANGAITAAFGNVYNQQKSANAQKERSFWDNPGAHLPSLPDGLVNAAAGFGDGVSFGLTDIFRDWMGTNGVVDQSSPEYGLSEIAGQLTTSTILVGGVLLRPLTAQSQVVTQWTTAGQLGANTRWVMTGGNSYRNYIMAGGPQLQASYSQSVTATVSNSSLRWPSGGEWLKGVLGQRVLK